MSYGKDERDIDMAVWRLAIPSMTQTMGNTDGWLNWVIKLKKIAALAIDESKHFPALRRQIRNRLVDSTKGQDIDELVGTMLTRAGSADTR
jgi:hypothetical protein